MTESGGASTYFMVRGKRFDMPREMTGREFRYIKQETGIRAGEIEQELDGGDTDLMLALVVVAMRRDGNPSAEVEDVLDLRIGEAGGIQVFAEEADRPTEGGAAEQEDESEPTAPAVTTGRRRSGTSSASSRGKSKT